MGTHGSFIRGYFTHKGLKPACWGPEVLGGANFEGDFGSDQ